MTITYYLPDANLCRTPLKLPECWHAPAQTRSPPSLWSHFIPWLYVSHIQYISNVFIPSQHFSNVILSYHCLLSTSNKISNRYLQLNMSKTELTFPSQTYRCSLPSQLMDLYPSSCSGKILGFLYNFSFSHIPFHSNPQYLESSRLLFYLLTQSWRSAALAALDLFCVQEPLERTAKWTA